MTSQCTLRRKLKDIRFKYGVNAYVYFIKYHVCQNCSEARLVVLNIHHISGRKVDEFKTLCFNCHMFEHNKNRKEETFLSCIQKRKEKELINEEKKQKNITTFK